MNGYLSSVGCDQMHWLVENEDMAHSFFYSPEDCTVKPTCESGADQAWFLLHCTLTGDFDTDTSTHPMALFSAGTEFGPMLSYGFAKYLTPEVAGTISDSLQKLSPDMFAEKFQKLHPLMLERDVYFIGDSVDEDLANTLLVYQEVRKFMLGVVERGDAVVTWVS